MAEPRTLKELAEAAADAVSIGAKLQVTPAEFDSLKKMDPTTWHALVATCTPFEHRGRTVELVVI